MILILMMNQIKWKLVQTALLNSCYMKTNYYYKNWFEYLVYNKNTGVAQLVRALV